MGSRVARPGPGAAGIRISRGRAIDRSQGRAYLIYGVLVVLVAGAVVFARNALAQPHRTSITLDGARLGPAFQGGGAISGGGGNSRLLIDYEARHERQAQQILDYLFKPGYGAALQILKLEIGGEAYATDGAEPSIEHTKGAINCDAGYEFWIAEQARKLNPRIQIYGLQWNAPHWVGGAWSKADIGYLLDWLNCAKQDGLAVNYLGGWNEHLPHGITPQVMGWFISLRRALDAHGYRNVQIVAVDSFAHENGTDVANFLARHPAFRRAIGVLGYHNLCRYPATGRTCLIPRAARASGKPIWESEIGALRQHTGVAAMTRSIINAFIQVGATGMIEWPLLDSMPANLPEEDRGLVFADQPWSGQYHVNLMTWVIAQTTQFTEPGWHHIGGGSGKLGGPWGSYTSYEPADHSAWSLVVQTTDAPAAQTIAVHVDTGLPRSAVHVWATNVRSKNPAAWFRPQPGIRPSGGRFTYRLRPGYLYTFTTTTGQGKGRGVSPAAVPMALPYVAVPDASGEPALLGPQDGAFEYPRGAAAKPGDYFEQTAVGLPVFWQNPVASRFPYAVVGDQGWRNYTVSASVSFTAPGQSAGLISRFRHLKANGVAQQFHGYQFVVWQDGRWSLIRNTIRARPAVLDSGTLGHALPVGTWIRLSLTASGSRLTASVNGAVVARATDTRYSGGDAGISTGGWYHVKFRDLTVTR